MTPLIPAPGQTEVDFLRWANEHPEKKVRNGAPRYREKGYMLALEKLEPEDGWCEPLSQFQIELIERVRRLDYEDHQKAYAKRILKEEGRVVKPRRYRPTDEERKATNAERQKRYRAKKVAAMTEDERKKFYKERMKDYRDKRAKKRATTPATGETTRPPLRLVHVAPPAPIAPDMLDDDAIVPQDLLAELDALDLCAPVALVAAMAIREGGGDRAAITATVAAEEPAPTRELTIDEQLEAALRPEPGRGIEIVTGGDDDLDEVDALYRDLNTTAQPAELALPADARPVMTPGYMRNPHFVPREERAPETEPTRAPKTIAEAKAMLAAMQERKRAARAAA